MLKYNTLGNFFYHISFHVSHQPNWENAKWELDNFFIKATKAKRLKSF